MMRATMMYAPGDVRVEERPEPTIQDPTDVIIGLSASCMRSASNVARPRLGGISHGRRGRSAPPTIAQWRPCAG